VQLRMKLELEVESMLHDYKAQQLRQDLLQRQAELDRLEAAKKAREEQLRREIEARDTNVSFRPWSAVGSRADSLTRVKSFHLVVVSIFPVNKLNRSRWLSHSS